MKDYEAGAKFASMIQRPCSTMGVAMLLLKFARARSASGIQGTLSLHYFHLPFFFN